MKGLLVGLLVLASTSHRGGAARVVQIPADGLRLGNALSRWSGCYKIARTAGLEFRATGSPVCGAFVGLPGCHAGSLAPKTTKIPIEPAWWLDNINESVAYIRRNNASITFECGGFRQSASYVDDATRAFLVKNWAQSIVRMADELWASAVGPLLGNGTATVALYHRQGDMYSDAKSMYHSCLPGPAFYGRAIATIRDEIFPGRRVVFVANGNGWGDTDRRHMFGDAIVVDSTAFAVVNHHDPRVVMATLARANASTFSFGTFSWWISYLGDGPTLYDSSLRNRARRPPCGLLTQLHASPKANGAFFIEHHLPVSWMAVGPPPPPPEPSSASGPQATGLSSSLPPPRVAVLLSGHVRNTFSARETLRPLLVFLTSCRTATRCDVFAHAYRHTEPGTATYHAREAEDAIVNETALVAELHPLAYLIADEANLADSPGDVGGRSWMSTAGIRSSFGAMRIALDLADRSAMRYDVYVRARYDMYRLREGTNVPARVSGCCFAHLDPDCLYWFDSTPTGVVSGQRTRGGGDNFLWARPRAWRAVLAQINDRFDETTARVFRGWGDVHLENLIQGAASILGLNVSSCGGPGPVLDTVPACAASKPSVTASAASVREASPTEMGITNPLSVLLIHSPDHFAERTAHTKRLLDFFRVSLGVRNTTVLPGIYYHHDLKDARAGCPNGTLCRASCCFNRQGGEFGLRLLGCAAAHRNAWATIAQCPGFERTLGGYYGPNETAPDGCFALRGGACIVEPRRCATDPVPAEGRIGPSTAYTVVLEDDAAIPRREKPRHIRARLARVFHDGVRAGADLIYLGHCGEFKANDKNGFSCTHAYAVTARGARALVDHTHSCQKGLAGAGAVDWAMIHYCQTQAGLTCYGDDSVIVQDHELPSTIHAPPTGRATT